MEKFTCRAHQKSTKTFGNIILEYSFYNLTIEFCIRDFWHIHFTGCISGLNKKN